ncbi:hypothetical protein D3C85_1614080 [compost metagenome]
MGDWQSMDSHAVIRVDGDAVLLVYSLAASNHTRIRLFEKLFGHGVDGIRLHSNPH